MPSSKAPNTTITNSGVIRKVLGKGQDLFDKAKDLHNQTMGSSLGKKGKEKHLIPQFHSESTNTTTTTTTRKFPLLFVNKGDRKGQDPPEGGSTEWHPPPTPSGPPSEHISLRLMTAPVVVLIRLLIVLLCFIPPIKRQA
ncbi:MAG: hypothetical protein GY799_09970 [Desulfobulbaceae bacterium]|nr:hypothetical protein [Desulfobulbaceae bacterium]